MPQLDIDALRRTVAQNRCVITAHAKQRMGHRRVTDHDASSRFLRRRFPANRLAADRQRPIGK
jgi:hypothetical protein